MPKLKAKFGGLQFNRPTAPFKHDKDSKCSEFEVHVPENELTAFLEAASDCCIQVVIDYKRFTSTPSMAA